MVAHHLDPEAIADIDIISLAVFLMDSHYAVMVDKPFLIKHINQFNQCPCLLHQSGNRNDHAREDQPHPDQSDYAANICYRHLFILLQQSTKFLRYTTNQ